MGLGLAMVLAAGTGCREELGPEPMPTTSVRGRVQDGGRPVGGGWVEFFPVGATVGKLRSAPLRPDGTFAADRVAIGTNTIRVKLVRPAGPVSGYVEAFGRQPLIERTIAPGPGDRWLELDLRREWIRHRRGRPDG